MGAPGWGVTAAHKADTRERIHFFKKKVSQKESTQSKMEVNVFNPRAEDLMLVCTQAETDCSYNPSSQRQVDVLKFWVYDKSGRTANWLEEI